MSYHNKFILDATAGFRMMWFDKHHPNTLYLDKRPECEPDQVADFTNLSQYSDKKFKLILFDPPHYVRKTTIADTNDKRVFGVLHSETWQNDIQKAFKELWRVLDDYGVLLFKWNNQDVSSDQVIALAPIQPLVYQVVSNQQERLNKKNSTRKVRTLWFCFMKIPKDSVNRQ